MREVMTVEITAGMIIFSPKSSLRVCPKCHVLDKVWSGDIHLFNEMIYLFTLNS